MKVELRDGRKIEGYISWGVTDYLAFHTNKEIGMDLNRGEDIPPTAHAVIRRNRWKVPAEMVWTGEFRDEAFSRWLAILNAQVKRESPGRIRPRSLTMYQSFAKTEYTLFSHITSSKDVRQLKVSGITSIRNNPRLKERINPTGLVVLPSEIFDLAVAGRHTFRITGGSRALSYSVWECLVFGDRISLNQALSHLVAGWDSACHEPDVQNLEVNGVRFDPGSWSAVVSTPPEMRAPASSETAGSEESALLAARKVFHSNWEAYMAECHVRYAPCIEGRDRLYSAVSKVASASRFEECVAMKEAIARSRWVSLGTAKAAARLGLFLEFSRGD